MSGAHWGVLVFQVARVAAALSYITWLMVSR